MLTEYFSSSLRDTTVSFQRALSFCLKDIKMCDVVRFNFQQQVESTTGKILGMLVNATRGHVISNIIFMLE